LNNLLERQDVECLLCDDGSTDGTYNFIRDNYPKIILVQNKKTKGLIYSRNKLMNQSQGEFVISLDDDLNFLTDNPLSIIKDYFELHPKCAVQSFRVFWSKKRPSTIQTNQKAKCVINFAGGAHVFRLQAWNDIPNYPSWFHFYGEENFASYHLFKKDWEIHYQPEILTHHRVELKQRKDNKDFITRQKRSLRSGWFLYLMFFPLHKIPRYFFQSIKVQIIKAIQNKEYSIFLVLFLAKLDVLRFLPKIIKNRNRLTSSEFKSYYSIPIVPLYWTPQND
jgi:glycosyltransferase involved in cell wall biosynthesis